MDEFFAAAAPGLEALAEIELQGLGLDTRLEAGGVTFSGGLPELYTANLHLRTGSRILTRLGDFYAAAFSELRKKAGRLAWERYLRPGQPVAVRAPCKKSKLFHSDAVAERVAGAIADRLGKPVKVQKPGGEEAEDPPQLVVVRLYRNHCTISIDSSGELLHRRGYRQAVAKAPLRETLAAAMLLASDWDGVSPLLDPFCGSGTIAIEAALLSQGIPPGARRRFAFMDWPGYDPGVWQELLNASSPKSPPKAPIIQASDRDTGAIRMAQANAERAGVAYLIEFSQKVLSAIEPPPGSGWIVTNPPYGMRVSENRDLRNLYAQIGNVLRQHCPSWQAAILCSDSILLGHTGLELETSFGFVNGGINVRMGQGKIPTP